MAVLTAGNSPGLLSPARIASFRLLWLGQSFSLLGDGFSYIAFSWITLSLTHSTLTLGYVLALQAIPRALLTLVGGALSDRWSARKLMMFSSWARSAVMTAVFAVGSAHLLNVAMLLVAAAAFGAVDAFFQPARSSILPSVVHRDFLPPANALLSVGSRVSSVLGPAVGGIVVAISNENYAFLIDGVCFALCGVCVAGVRTVAPVPAEEGSGQGIAGVNAAPVESMASRIKAGLHYAWTDAQIRTVLIVDTAVTFCYAGPFTVGFADLAKFQLQGGSTTLGALNGCLAGGALAGAVVAGTVAGRPPVGFLIAGLTGWLAAGMALLGMIHSIAAAAATVLAMGFAIGFQGVFGLSWIQRSIQGSVLSRVISLDMVLGYAVAPLSLVLCGAVAQHHAGLMFGGTAALLVLTTAGVLCSRPVRQMR